MKKACASVIKRLGGLGGRSSLIQYSVFQTDRRRVAVVAKKLAEHYGASTAHGVLITL